MSPEALYLLAEMNLIHGLGWKIQETASEIRISREEQIAIYQHKFNGGDPFWFCVECFPECLELPKPFKSVNK